MSRGFSFKSKKKLDMSMGLTKLNAIDIINNLSEDQLKNIIKILVKKRRLIGSQKILLKKENTEKLNMFMS